MGLRNEAGECLDGPENLCGNDNFCKGCASCASDACGLLVETECTISTVEVTTTTSTSSSLTNAPRSAGDTTVESGLAPMWLLPRPWTRPPSTLVAHKLTYLE